MTVDWNVIEQIMKCIGFPAIFVHWLMECTTSISYSIMINGEFSERFHAKRGLRLGDPMSPYLFVLCMEYLNRALTTLCDIPDFNFHPRCQKVGVIHLCFADDLLLFSRGDLTSVKLLHGVFQDFSAVSGLRANLGKSQVYFGGMAHERKTRNT